MTVTSVILLLPEFNSSKSMVGQARPLKILIYFLVSNAYKCSKKDDGKGINTIHVPVKMHIYYVVDMFA